MEVRKPLSSQLFGVRVVGGFGSEGFGSGGFGSEGLGSGRAGQEARVGGVGVGY